MCVSVSRCIVFHTFSHFQSLSVTFRTHPVPAPISTTGRLSRETAERAGSFGHAYLSCSGCIWGVYRAYIGC